MSKLFFDLGYKLNAMFFPGVGDALKTFTYLDNLSETDFLSYRVDRFKELITYANENVEYYRNIIKSRGLKISDIHDINYIENFPVLTRDIIRNNANDLVDKNLNSYKYLNRRSGGTTGEPVRAIIDRYTQAIETLCFFRGLRWMGWNPDIKMIRLSGGTLGFGNKFNMKIMMRNLFMNTSMLPAFGINEKTAAKYFEVINNSKDSVILGYASALLNLATFKKKLNIKTPNVKFLISTAELLTPDWQKRISEAFECDIKCYFGCGEIESIAFQSEMNGPYIVADDIVYLESKKYENIDNSFLITSLYNKAMPFIRYYNGDLGETAEGEYFGRKRMIITKLQGRVSDMLQNTKGEFVSGMFIPHLIFQSKLPVRKYQLIQLKLNEFEFRYEPEEDKVIEEELADQFRQALIDVFSIDNAPVKINFIKSSSFITAENKKHRITLNLTSNN